MATRTSNNKRKTRTGFTPYIVGIGVGALVAFFFASRSVRDVEASVEAKPQIVAEYDTVSVPVPSEFVTVGTPVKNIKFKNVAYPKHQLPANVLRDVSSIIESFTIAALPANLPLYQENFSFTSQAKNPVIEKIPAGMRAMTIRVDATSAVEGWAGSGAVVDVLLVEREQTTVVAEGVKILSAERSVAPVEGTASPNVPSTVTLLVTQEQCLAINTAIPMGKIAFALRSLNDEQGWRDLRYTAENLKTSKGGGSAKTEIRGYIEVKDKVSAKKYALSEDKWIKTDSAPQGFMGNFTRKFSENSDIEKETEEINQ